MYFNVTMREDVTMSREKGGISIFQKYLTIWNDEGGFKSIKNVSKNLMEDSRND